MNITLYTLNYAPELTGIGKYNGEMAPWLAEQGADVSVICAPPYYPEWQVHSGYSAAWYAASEYQGVSIVRCPLYVPKTPSTIKRLIHLGSFAISSSLALFRNLLRKPDVVFVVEPTLFTVPAALLFCKFTGARSVLHIQDYEVDAMFGLGLGGGSGKLASVAYRIECWLMQRFDRVSTISLSMMERARSKGVDEGKLLFFPNWSDTDFVTPDADGTQLRKDWGFKPDDKLVLYAGNMGAKQGLELVLEAACHYKNDTNVHFVMVGAGAHVGKLQQEAERLQLSNLHFKPLQAWEDVPAMLAMADVHLVVQRRGAADAVLPSKLTNILSAGGHAVVTAEPDTELGKLADQYPGIYECTEPENLEAFCGGLDRALARSTAAGINRVAREYAEKNLNKEAILGRFLSDMAELTDSRTK